MIEWVICFIALASGPFIYMKLTGIIDAAEAFHRAYFMVLGAVIISIVGPWR